MRAKPRSRTLYRVALGLLSGWCASSAALAETPCAYNKEALSFEGSAIEQARCLLRPVLIRAALGSLLQDVPEGLRCVGAQVPISKERLRQHLGSSGIAEEDLGGSLDEPVSSAAENVRAGVYAKYFVIHDTSTPNYLGADFPGNIDTEQWPHNDLSRWVRGERSKAHVFINRLGESVSARSFAIPWRATKFELADKSKVLKGRFLHIELVQPRRSHPKLGKNNDALAPAPGFTAKQYERLALIYLAASVRAGECLIPAYHAVIDAGKADGHDDPQNFSLEQFGDTLVALQKRIDRAAED